MLCVPGVPGRQEGCCPHPAAGTSAPGVCWSKLTIRLKSDLGQILEIDNAQHAFKMNYTSLQQLIQPRNRIFTCFPFVPCRSFFPFG